MKKTVACILGVIFLCCTNSNCENNHYSDRTDLGLIGQNYSVETGRSIDRFSQIGCYVDSYYEYLYKGWRLFGDEDLKTMWENSIRSVQLFIPFENKSGLWYGTVDARTGQPISSIVTLWDAYFPALLIYSGDSARAVQSLKSWDSLWSVRGLLPMGYNFITGEVTNPRYDLNPELIESAYYVWYFTKDPNVLNMMKKYYSDIKTYCRTEIAYANIEDIVSKTQSDQLPTFFFAETMKYFYLAFDSDAEVTLGNTIFSTEAHPFKLKHFDKEKIGERLGI